MASPLTTGRAVCIKKKIHFSKDGVVDMIKENWIFQLRQQPVSNIDGFLPENLSGLTRPMQGDMLTISLWNLLQDALCLQGVNI